jgi:outer membrane protein TolC
VLARNPTVAAARAAWRAAEARPAQARALDDPMVGYSIAPASIGASEVRFGQVVDFSQRFPFPGKLGLRAAVETAEARAERGGYESARRDIALMGSMLFDDYWAAERSLAINTEHHRLLSEQMDSAKAQYGVGRLEQHELIGVEIELAHVQHDHVVLGAERRVVVARLNALLRRPAHAPLPSPPGALDDLVTPAGNAEELAAEAVRTRPETSSAAARIDAAESGAALARREYFPDFGVGASYSTMWDMPEHRAMAGISINVPLQLGRRKAAVDEAEAQVIRRRSEHDAVVDRIAAEVEIARQRLAEADHIVLLYRDRILPASRDRVDATRAGLESGDVEYETLIETTHDLRDAELASEIAIADRSRRRAELIHAVGRIPGVPGGERR